MTVALLSAEECKRLLFLHMRLECVGIDVRGDMVRIPGDEPDGIARLYLAKIPGDVFYAYRFDVPLDIRSQIDVLSVETRLHDHGRVKQILEAHAPCMHVHYGRSYVFPAIPPKNDYPDVIEVDEFSQSLFDLFEPPGGKQAHAVFAVLKDGKIVSACQSSRENERAGEAWVRTSPEYRGRGYARQVVSAWAVSLLQQNKTPFYSHVNNNLASKGLAESLGLVQYISDTGYE